MPKIPTSQLRDALRDSHRSKSEICRELGWFRTDQPRPAIEKLNRALGLKADRQFKNGKQYESRRLTIDTERAAEIIRAADLDPMDYGL